MFKPWTANVGEAIQHGRTTAAFKNKGGRITPQQIIFIEQQEIKETEVFKAHYYIKP